MQPGTDRIFSKIDIIMANQAWISRYEFAEVVFLNEGLFDHSHAIVSLHPAVVGGNKPFKYFRMWKSYPKYDDQLKEVWNSTCMDNKMFQVVSKMTQFKARLRLLNKEGYCNLLQQVEKSKAGLEAVQNQIKLQPLDHLLRNLRKTSEGSMVTPDQADYLLQQFNKEDIRKAAFSIPANKSPGLDGFSSNFFQDNWEIIGDDICEVVLTFLDSGNILKEINSTIITLVPKIKCPNSVKDFRPIACCNVIYKIATKLLSSRINNILPEIISHSQGGFVKGRFIGHNILICQDLVRHYGRKTYKPCCMIKLDIQKAYDTIEWGFIEEMLRGLKFPKKFIQLVMNCITTPRFSLMFNGTLHGFFESKRGIRQGDPMSPLLFVLGMEYLSRLMLKIGEKGDFKFQDRCTVLKLNHLAFADDVLLFCHGDFRSILYMLQALKTFSLTSGLHPNASKTAIYCSNMQSEVVNQIIQLSGFTKQDMPFTYLRIPICGKKISGKELLRSIEAIWRAFLWKGQALFQGGGSVAWSNVCQSKAAGGLGIKNIELWNQAAICYKLFLPTLDRLNWSREVWSRHNTPKHSVITWMAMLNRLKTHDRLIQFGIQVQATAIYAVHTLKLASTCFLIVKLQVTACLS
uniref:Reverse transcriptase domain-containing protein n=1 Tax=Cannabis sativa TaxID=3483 RepID=A0A803PA33_CANSA